LCCGLLTAAPVGLRGRHGVVRPNDACAYALDAAAGKPDLVLAEALYDLACYYEAVGREKMVEEKFSLQAAHAAGPSPAQASRWLTPGGTTARIGR